MSRKLAQENCTHAALPSPLWRPRLAARADTDQDRLATSAMATPTTTRGRRVLQEAEGSLLPLRSSPGEIDGDAARVYRHASDDALLSAHRQRRDKACQPDSVSRRFGVTAPPASAGVVDEMSTDAGGKSWRAAAATAAGVGTAASITATRGGGRGISIGSWADAPGSAGEGLFGDDAEDDRGEIPGDDGVGISGMPRGTPDHSRLGAAAPDGDFWRHRLVGAGANFSRDKSAAGVGISSDKFGGGLRVGGISVSAGGHQTPETGAVVEPAPAPIGSSRWMGNRSVGAGAHVRGDLILGESYGSGSSGMRWLESENDDGMKVTLPTRHRHDGASLLGAGATSAGAAVLDTTPIPASRAAAAVYSQSIGDDVGSPQGSGSGRDGVQQRRRRPAPRRPLELLLDEMPNHKRTFAGSGGPAAQNGLRAVTGEGDLGAVLANASRDGNRTNHPQLSAWIVDEMNRLFGVRSAPASGIPSHAGVPAGPSQYSQQQQSFGHSTAAAGASAGFGFANAVALEGAAMQGGVVTQNTSTTAAAAAVIDVLRPSSRSSDLESIPTEELGSSLREGVGAATVHDNLTAVSSHAHKYAGNRDGPPADSLAANGKFSDLEGGGTTSRVEAVASPPPGDHSRSPVSTTAGPRVSERFATTTAATAVVVAEENNIVLGKGTTKSLQRLGGSRTSVPPDLATSAGAADRGLGPPREAAVDERLLRAIDDGQRANADRRSAETSTDDGSGRSLSKSGRGGGNVGIVGPLGLHRRHAGGDSPVDTKAEVATEAGGGGGGCYNGKGIGREEFIGLAVTGQARREIDTDHPTNPGAVISAEYHDRCSRLGLVHTANRDSESTKRTTDQLNGGHVHTVPAAKPPANNSTERSGILQNVENGSLLSSRQLPPPPPPPPATRLGQHRPLPGSSAMLLRRKGSETIGDGEGLESVGCERSDALEEGAQGVVGSVVEELGRKKENAAGSLTGEHQSLEV